MKVTHDHVTVDERDYIAHLENLCKTGLHSVEDRIALGLLYLEPLHEPEGAAKLFITAINEDQRSVLAKYLLSYTYVHYMIDRESMVKAKHLLESATLEPSEWSGAVYVLLAYVLRELGELSSTEYVDMLERSVQLAPHWANNRICLASAYELLGEKEKAVQQLQLAKINILKWRLMHLSLEHMTAGRVTEIKIQQINERLVLLLGKK